jgi:chitin synthase
LFSGLGASARNSTLSFADDATVSIPLEGDDDVFGPEDGLTSEHRHSLKSRDSYMTSSTLTEEENKEDYEHYDML